MIQLSEHDAPHSKHMSSYSKTTVVRFTLLPTVAVPTKKAHFLDQVTASYSLPTTNLVLQTHHCTAHTDHYFTNPGRSEQKQTKNKLVPN